MHAMSEITKECEKCKKEFLVKLNAAWRSPLCGTCNHERQLEKKRAYWKKYKESKNI